MSGIRWIAGLAACVVVLSTALPAAAASGPREMLQQMTDDVLAEIRRNPEQLRDIRAVRVLAERYILPRIDFHAAAQWVLGKHWRTASSQQRSDFEHEFRALLLNTYLRAVSDYQENRITIFPARGELDRGRAEVDAEVELPGRPPVHIGFRLHRTGEDWRIFDITVEGVSLVTTHRSGFSREIAEQGLDSLIRRLAVQNEQADGAAPEQCTAC
jgi:phospholipid transport system substrate-binding protein